MLKIIRADYGGLDVTSALQSKIKNDNLCLMSSNQIAGDPKPGMLKKLTVDYESDEKAGSVEAIEGSILMLPPTQTKKLGIFYTNNHIDPRIIRESLETIRIAAKKHETDIITCPWEHIEDNPFNEIISRVQIGSHFNIAFQICTLLSIASRNSSKSYESVSFLEHDVLYGEDYFNYENLDGTVVCNHNYIGLCKDGFQLKGQPDEPLHQLTMKFDSAVEHFKNVLYGSIAMQQLLEPDHFPVYKQRRTAQSSIHVNHGRHFTSHYNIYIKNYHNYDAYWGTYENLINKLGL